MCKVFRVWTHFLILYFNCSRIGCWVCRAKLLNWMRPHDISINMMLAVACVGLVHGVWCTGTRGHHEPCFPHYHICWGLINIQGNAQEPGATLESGIMWSQYVSIGARDRGHSYTWHVTRDSWCRVWAGTNLIKWYLPPGQLGRDHRSSCSCSARINTLISANCEIKLQCYS